MQVNDESDYANRAKQFSFKTLPVPQIGTVKSSLNESQYIPYDKLAEMESTIELEPELLPHIEGLERYYTIFVLYYLDRITPEQRVASCYPRGDVTKPKRGVLATRSPVRPTPLGMSQCIITAINGTSIIVKGLDALNNSPVIDIKPGLKNDQKEFYISVYN